MCRSITITLLIVASLTLKSQTHNLSEVIKNYESYRTAAKKWFDRDFLHSAIATRIEIELPKDRTRYGTLTMGRYGMSNKFESIYAKVNCLGRAVTKKHPLADQIAKETGSSSYFKNIPTGHYYGFVLDKKIAALALPSLTKKDIGNEGVIVLVSMDKSDRAGYLVHAGPPVQGNIRPGLGAITVSRKDMRELVNTIIYTHAGISEKDTAERRKQFDKQPEWAKIDAYQSFILVSIVERKARLKEKISKKSFGKQGLDPSADTMLNYSKGYIDPLPISSYSMASEYYKAISINKLMVILQIMDELDQIKTALDKFNNRQIDGKSAKAAVTEAVDNIDAQRKVIDDWLKFNKNAQWSDYARQLLDFVRGMRSEIKVWDTNTNKRPPGADCALIDTKCDLVVLSCLYQCLNGARFSEACGVCFIFPF